jgi:hypothetical protein
MPGCAMCRRLAICLCLRLLARKELVDVISDLHARANSSSALSRHRSAKTLPLPYSIRTFAFFVLLVCMVSRCLVPEHHRWAAVPTKLSQQRKSLCGRS